MIVSDSEGGIGIALPPTDLLLAGAVGLVLVALLFGIGTFVLWHRLRQQRPAIERAVERGRDLLVEVRPRLATSPTAKEAATMRRDLRRSLAATARQIEVAEGQGVPTVELTHAHRQLSEAAKPLERQLRLVEQESDPRLREVGLDETRRRTGEVLEVAARIREAAMGGAGAGLAGVRSEVEREAAALRTWRETYRSIGG